MSRIGLHSAYMAFTGPQPQVGQQAGPLAGLTVAIKDMFDIAGGACQWRKPRMA